MRVLDFDYPLDPSLIADRPPATRDGARLLVVPPDGAFEDRSIAELDAVIPSNALVVVNDTRVVKARLFGTRLGSGGKIELLLLRPRAEGHFEVLGRSSKALRRGTRIDLGDGYEAEITREREGAGRTLEAAIRCPAGGSVERLCETRGHVPLPPYIDREDDAADADRYQSIFAAKDGASAAPTASLHLTEALVDRMKARGVEIGSTTLHVGLGTFEPVNVDDFDDHPMHAEWCEVDGALVEAVARARARGAPVVAIGTTVVRALETAAAREPGGLLRAFRGETRILIQPGYRFEIVDALVTNFHLPKSTLLALVSAFAGRDRVLGAYAHAISERYRLFSYGDAMYVERPR